MVTWGKSCSDCPWNQSCEHKKILWDGIQYQYVTAICRSMDGQEYIPWTMPSEPQDWFLWATLIKPKGLVVYGRSQLLYESDIITDLAISDTRSTPRRTSKVLSSTVIVAQRDPVAKPLPGLKSVYSEDNSSQGSLF